MDSIHILFLLYLLLWFGFSTTKPQGFHLALEKESDQHLNNYRPGGGVPGAHGKGYQGSRPGQGTTPKHAHARIMENVEELFWCDARDCSTPLTASRETAS